MRCCAIRGTAAARAGSGSATTSCAHWRGFSCSSRARCSARAYVRNTYKFKLGWKYVLLEPMDIVLLTDATLGLAGAAVRITAIAEDDNGELTVTAEEIPGVTP